MNDGHPTTQTFQPVRYILANRPRVGDIVENVHTTVILFVEKTRQTLRVRQEHAGNILDENPKFSCLGGAYESFKGSSKRGEEAIVRGRKQAVPSPRVDGEPARAHTLSDIHHLEICCNCKLGRFDGRACEIHVAAWQINSENLSPALLYGTNDT